MSCIWGEIREIILLDIFATFKDGDGWIWDDGTFAAYFARDTLEGYTRRCYGLFALNIGMEFAENSKIPFAYT